MDTPNAIKRARAGARAGVSVGVSTPDEVDRASLARVAMVTQYRRMTHSHSHYLGACTVLRSVLFGGILIMASLNKVILL